MPIIDRALQILKTPMNGKGKMSPAPTRLKATGINVSDEEIPVLVAESLHHIFTSPLSQHFEAIIKEQVPFPNALGKKHGPVTTVTSVNSEGLLTQFLDQITTEDLLNTFGSEQLMQLLSSEQLAEIRELQAQEKAFEEILATLLNITGQKWRVQNVEKKVFFTFTENKAAAHQIIFGLRYGLEQFGFVPNEKDDKGVAVVEIPQTSLSSFSDGPAPTVGRHLETKKITYETVDPILGTKSTEIVNEFVSLSAFIKLA